MTLQEALDSECFYLFLNIALSIKSKSAVKLGHPSIDQVYPEGIEVKLIDGPIVGVNRGVVVVQGSSAVI